MNKKTQFEGHWQYIHNFTMLTQQLTTTTNLNKSAEKQDNDIYLQLKQQTLESLPNTPFVRIFVKLYILLIVFITCTEKNEHYAQLTHNIASTYKTIRTYQHINVTRIHGNEYQPRNLIIWMAHCIGALIFYITIDKQIRGGKRSKRTAYKELKYSPRHSKMLYKTPTTKT